MGENSRSSEARALMLERAAREKSNVVNFRAPPNCRAAIQNHAAKHFMTVTEAILDLIDKGLRADEDDEADEAEDVELNPHFPGGRSVSPFQSGDIGRAIVRNGRRKPLFTNARNQVIGFEDDKK